MNRGSTGKQFDLAQSIKRKNVHSQVLSQIKSLFLFSYDENIVQGDKQ